MKTSFRTIALVFGREFRAYFATPLAAVFLLVFLALSAGLAFFAGGFFERGQADLGPALRLVGIVGEEQEETGFDRILQIVG